MADLTDELKKVRGCIKEMEAHLKRFRALEIAIVEFVAKHEIRKELKKDFPDSPVPCKVCRYAKRKLWNIGQRWCVEANKWIPKFPYDKEIFPEWCPINPQELKL